jgi:eukaryotic-like serine/threonine-protein kinase
MASALVMDRFRVAERIGSGGMGVVYRAFDERLQREVALKEIIAADADRVLREAQAAARLNHPGIVSLYELGRHGNRALLVSELVPGSTLSELRAVGALSDRDVAELGTDLCDALSHAHSRGVVHRDLKPQNVIVRDDEIAGRRAKLMDFGVARIAGSPTLTASGEVLGTLAYMAPEQAEGFPAGPPADLYSLALTLYECWAGVNPVAVESPAATARRIGRPLDPLGEHRPDLPEELAAAIDACLAPEPEERPAAAALRAVLDRAIPALDSARPVPAPWRVETNEGDQRRRRLFGPVALAASLTVLALLATLGGAPGLALVCAVLALPAILVLPGIRAVLPLACAPLAALGAMLAYPAFAALAGDRAAHRALAGGLGWLWALAGAIALGTGPSLGIASRAPKGWESSAADAAAEVLAPLLTPAALLGAGAFALGAISLGWILAARHLAVAALGAMLWAGGLSGLVGVLADGTLGERPLFAALGAALALAIERSRRSRGRRSPPPLPSLEWRPPPPHASAAQGGR